VSYYFVPRPSPTNPASLGQGLMTCFLFCPQVKSYLTCVTYFVSRTTTSFCLPLSTFLSLPTVLQLPVHLSVAIFIPIYICIYIFQGYQQIAWYPSPPSEDTRHPWIFHPYLIFNHQLRQKYYYHTYSPLQPANYPEEYFMKLITLLTRFLKL
jgi:hypothetical protein